MTGAFFCDLAKTLIIQLVINNIIELSTQQKGLINKVKLHTKMLIFINKHEKINIQSV